MAAGATLQRYVRESICGGAHASPRATFRRLAGKPLLGETPNTTRGDSPRRICSPESLVVSLTRVRTRLDSFLVKRDRLIEHQWHGFNMQPERQSATSLLA